MFEISPAALLVVLAAMVLGHALVVAVPGLLLAWALGRAGLPWVAPAAPLTVAILGSAWVHVAPGGDADFHAAVFLATGALLAVVLLARRLLARPSAAPRARQDA